MGKKGKKKPSQPQESQPAAAEPKPVPQPKPSEEQPKAEEQPSVSQRSVETPGTVAPSQSLPAQPETTQMTKTALKKLRKEQKLLAAGDIVPEQPSISQQSIETPETVAPSQSVPTQPETTQMTKTALKKLRKEQKLLGVGDVIPVPSMAVKGEPVSVPERRKEEETVSKEGKQRQRKESQSAEQLQKETTPEPQKEKKVEQPQVLQTPSVQPSIGTQETVSTVESVQQQSKTTKRRQRKAAKATDTEVPTEPPEEKKIEQPPPVQPPISEHPAGKQEPVTEPAQQSKASRRQKKDQKTAPPSEPKTSEGISGSQTPTSETYPGPSEVSSAVPRGGFGRGAPVGPSEIPVGLPASTMDQPQRGQGRGRGTPQDTSRSQTPVSEAYPAPQRGRGQAPRGQQRGKAPSTPQETSRSQTPVSETYPGLPTGRGQAEPHVPWGGRGAPVRPSVTTEGLPSSSAGLPRQQPSGRGRGTGPQQRQPQRTDQRVPSPATSVPVVTRSMGELSLVQKKPRIGGREGRRITVETNHYPLKISYKVPVAIHYDITITPDKPKRMMRPVWEAYRKKYLPNAHPAFDDVKNLYSPVKLPENKLVGEVMVQEDDFSRPREYKVVIKHAANVNLLAVEEYIRNAKTLPQDAIQCLDVVLRNAPALRFIRVGRSYFTQPREIIPLGQGMEMWHGFYQSVTLGWKPYLNVDVVHKSFPKRMHVIDLIMELLNRTREGVGAELRNYESDTLSKFLKGLKIQYELPDQPTTRRCMRVNGCVKSASQAAFVDENGKQTNVERYYFSIKRYQLKFPNLPCLWVGPRDKKIYYPPELCTVLPGQVINRKMNENQTRTMVRYAATSTDIRKQKITEQTDKASFNSDPCVQAFGLSVGDYFERVPARILEPPTLEYANSPSGGSVIPDKGVWRCKHFIDGKNIENCAVLSLGRTRDNEIDYFVSLLRKCAEQQNMKIGNVKKPYDKMYITRDIRPLQQYFDKHKGMDIIFVIVPEGDIYNKVKSAAELSVGCLTQCMKERTMFKSMNMSTVSNILLKVNAKLNGHNHKISDTTRPRCLNKPCLIMGADVTHPSPDQRDKPSIAAVAASHDPTASKYNFCWRLQPPRQEIITDLENIVVEQLQYFFTHNNRQPPCSIIFFRDGVSEGQFAQVMDAEFNAIKKACSRVNPNYKPPITFLVVQKRHHTRFFPTNKRDSQDRNFNVPAGTCVDTEIVHRTEVEYYLVSHASIQGVARPTKYRVLWDDNGMSEDEIQKLTYYLCHMFSRCTRSVSYPAPTYYAHLAAARASVYFDSDINMQNLKQEEVTHQIKEVICKQKPMFFI